MVTFSEAQLMGWLSAVIWPFLRVLALMTSAPGFATRAIPMRVKIGLSFLVALSVWGLVPGVATVRIDSPGAVAAALQQVSIGLAVGFVARLIVATAELAGELIGLQMGLNFAAFFDPVANTQSSAVSRLFGQIALMLLVIANVHIVLLMVVVRSFEYFPVSADGLSAIRGLHLHELGAEVFAGAFWIAIPVIALLMFANLVLGFISRIAPQMNIYSIGFPVTVVLGMFALTGIVPALEEPMAAVTSTMLSKFLYR